MATNGHGHTDTSPWADDPIAIVGMGSRLPGSVRTPQQFWDLLTVKGSGRCRVPADRYNVDAFVGPKGKPGHTCTEYGYFLQDVDLATIDSSFWSMTRKEIEMMDPQQRLLLEVVYECLEHSGATGFKDQDIGCYVGVFGEDWAEIQAKDPQTSGTYQIIGYGDFAIANRISYELGLTGPSMTIRTACSSSLTALHEACQGIYAGECSSAVVGGCNMILSPHVTIAMAEQGVLSPTGYSYSFDARANGYARGEAINAIYIKRLSTALRDGDNVHAVIRSTCISSDGKTAGMSVPSPQSHEALIRRSHQLASITDLSKTAMIECHATGTAVGDPLEIRAVAQVFGEWGILIGSVKPNIGHSEGASGLSSVIKMALALQNQTIPPNINFSTPNPKIPFDTARLRVPVDCEPWPSDRHELVGVNSFGIGGANAHVLLESARSWNARQKPQTNGTNPVKQDTHLFVFSASHPKALTQSITNTAEYIRTHSSQAVNCSYTLGCRRERFAHRAFAVGSADSWDVSPSQRATHPPDLVWVFTGQGAQYPGMGRELIANSAIAQETIHRLDQVLDEIDPHRNWTLYEEIMSNEASSNLKKAEFAQPCCIALQIALVDVLRALNVRPSAVVGHSSGEIAAAYAVNALSAAEAIAVAYHRGKVSRKAEEQGQGGMMVVGLGREDVTPFLNEHVTIACENSPYNVTLSGNVKALDTIAGATRARHPDVLVRKLRVNCAYHSAQMKEVEGEYRERLACLHAPDQPLSADFISSVTGKSIHNASELSAEYWCRNLTSPVLFHTAVANLLADESRSSPVFLEVGPHSALSGQLREIAVAKQKSVPYISTLVRKADAYASMLRTAGRLFQANAAIDLSNLCQGTLLSDLPPYPWHYEGHFWFESRTARDWRLRKYPHHDLLGSQITDGNAKEPTWRSVIHLENVPWIREHNVLGQTIFPGAGYIAMVGEAIRQLTDSHDFTVRNVNVLAAMVMHEDRPTEILSQFRPARVTATLNSEWYDFTVTSLLDGVWTKHCTGQARGGRECALDVPCPVPGARKVQSPVWYRTMKKSGLNYGPRFQGMQKIAASVVDQTATAEIVDSREHGESSYTLHPCTIDSIFQLFSVAGSEGIPRHFMHVHVPTYIDELYIRPPIGTIAAQTSVDMKSKGAFAGDASGFCGEVLVFSLRFIRLSLLSDDDEIRGADPHAGSRLVWKPDIDEVDLMTFLHPVKDITDQASLVEELGLSCMLQTEYQTREIAPALPHYPKYREWLRMQVQRVEEGAYGHVPTCQTIANMSSAERASHIDNLYRRALNTDGRDVATGIKRICEQSTALFSGSVDSLALLMEGDLLTAIYSGGKLLCDFSDFFRVFAHNRPHMRVLEVGAGTGGATAMILPALQGPHGIHMYDSYTYTDISTGFFSAAQGRFKEYTEMIYRPLDITADPEAQGFEPASYDLVVASNALHATPSLAESLNNVRALLKPDGKLFLQELAPTSKWFNYIMGTLPGWWLGELDGRVWEPYVSSARWDAELRQAGLSGIDAEVHDGHFNTHIISSAVVAQDVSAATRRKRVTVLSRTMEPSQAVSPVLSKLQKQGFDTDICCLDDERPAEQMVISLLELEEPFLHDCNRSEFLLLRGLLSSLGTTPLLWVTRSSQVSCSDPRYAPTLGFFRIARKDLSLSAATLELDRIDDKAMGMCVTVAERVLRNFSSDPLLDPVSEYAYNQGQLLVGKFYPASVGNELLDSGHSTQAAALHVGKRGLLQTLSWKPSASSASTSTVPLPDDWVEVETYAVGLNFKDLLIAMGVVEGGKLGIECAGVVLGVGPGVRRLAVGDRVVALTAGAFATTVVTSERLCVPIAVGLSWIEGATMPCVFATVLYSLVDVGHLRADQTVLIHSACGGIGLAAIQVCRMIGAEIYCTVGSESKVKYLIDMGIPRDRIFCSRDNTFLPGILAATGGRGVDIVLNSLSGELLHVSWKCVAEFGTMVELGKRDFIGKGQLAMEAFEANRTFAGVDLGLICERRPDIIEDLLRRCMQQFAQGQFTPLPVQEFAAETVEQAFRYMQKGTHIGKVAVAMPSTASTLPLSLTPRLPRFRSDACHVIVGGLRGLGRSIASWMAHHGARHFVSFLRSAGQMEQDDFVLELRAQAVGLT
ncbi:hypothetical protein BDW74DRAFT_179029 [Aspergillus multicolor]|uniref:uncharacterized protein n=1 Tax=Aspergillus multicolor TaxID=41759 RepID=UPI003CCCBDF6